MEVSCLRWNLLCSGSEDAHDLSAEPNAHLSTPPRIYGGGRVALSFAGRKTVAEERFDPPSPPPPSTPNPAPPLQLLLSSTADKINSTVPASFSVALVFVVILRFGDGWEQSPFWQGWGGWGVEGVLAAKNAVFTETTSSFYGSVKKCTASVCCWSVVMFGMMCAGIPGSTNRTRWCKNKQTKQRSPCKTPPLAGSRVRPNRLRATTIGPQNNNV